MFVCIFIEVQQRNIWAIKSENKMTPQGLTVPAVNVGR